MTLRDNIRRRLYLINGALIVVVGGGGTIWWLGYTGQFKHWWPSLGILIGAFAVTSWAGGFAVRCPKCRVRITGNVLTALTSRLSARRYNYCPGCGTALDTELTSLRRKE